MAHGTLTRSSTTLGGNLPGADRVLMRATYVFPSVCICLCILGNAIIMPGNNTKRNRKRMAAKRSKAFRQRKRLPENGLPAGLALGLAFMEKGKVQQTAMYSNLVSGQRRKF